MIVRVSPLINYLTIKTMQKKNLSFKTSVFFIIIICVSFPGKAQTYFWDDFSGGLTQFNTYDGDGLKPDPGVTGTLFGASAPYKAWVIDSQEGDKFAISTSRYSPAGKSNDWLVTVSPIHIQSASANLTWKARSFNTTVKDGYKVYISTTGNKVSDFSEVVYTNAGENTGWTTHSINLASYAGSSIYIAFVNDSENKWVLGIDNIFVGVTGYSIVDNTLQYTYYKKVAVKYLLKNLGNPITEFTMKYTADGKTYTKIYSGVNLSAGNSYSFEFADSITVNGVGNSVTYSLEVSSGAIVKSTNGSVTLASFKPFKKVVIEEATGTWCGYCPRGMVYMKKMKEKYPDRFIGIAVHNNDPMVDATYNTGLGKFVSSFPSGVVNRKYTCDPLSFETNYLKAINDFSPADLILSAEWVDASHTSMKLKSEAVFNVPFNGTANFRMGLVVVENNVKGTVTGYNQRNYYSGGGIGAMEGWESLPDPVPAAQMIYQDVARKIYDSFNGISESLPAAIAMNQRFKFEYDFDLPATINNKNETEIILMLMDNKTGEIMNGRKIKFADIPVGIATIKESGASVKIRKDASRIVADVETHNSGPVNTTLLSIDGKQIFTSTVNNVNKHSFEIPFSGLRGIYIIRIRTNEGNFNEKIVLE
jgi:thiol-disulfide isomerase/thioredoxin